MSKRQRSNFDATFKLQVVQMIRQQSLSVCDVCRDMNLGETAVRRWLKQSDEEAAGRLGLGKPITVEPQRIRQLEVESKQLRGDVDILKSFGLLCPGTGMSYQLVETLTEKASTIATLCRVLSVSRSGYYGSLQHAREAPKVCATSVQRKAEFATSNQQPAAGGWRLAVMSMAVDVWVQ